MGRIRGSRQFPGGSAGARRHSRGIEILYIPGAPLGPARQARDGPGGRTPDACLGNLITEELWSK